jgi:hypothetical protein
MHQRTALITTPTLLATMLAAPADAAPALTTYTLAKAGTLTITAPSAASLGSAPPGGQLTVKLATVKVTDTRAPGGGPWTATVSSTDYTKASPPIATISRVNMTYWSGPATVTQGSGTFTPGQLTAAQKVNLSTTRTAFSHSNGATNNASWQPTLQLSIPFAAAVTTGNYTGTITHSVG